MIAVELKVNEFKPEYSQQLNWYLHLLDKTVKYPDDNNNGKNIYDHGKTCYASIIYSINLTFETIMIG